MSSLMEHIDRFELVDLLNSWNAESECESPGHWRTPEDHGGPGATRMFCPCGYNGIICATFRDVLGDARRFRCAYEVRHETSSLRFVDL